ncbi:MAG TPA: DsbA family oxidoreductase [Afifellaceae bacterium]|nr:DsbA family oxidoreductase [Afifellaceae bacterium]
MTETPPGSDAEASAETAIVIDVVSDVMCPWCYIGKRRLEAAIENTPYQLDIHWRPFQLDGTLPPDGKDRKAYLAEKFGSVEKAGQIYENVTAAGDLEGIPFAFDKIEVSPNTLDAHRLIRWAGGASQDLQDRIVESLFQAYFLYGENIGDHAVLVRIAEDAGMDGKLVAEMLAKDADRDLVSKEIELSQKMGVTGVPTFIVDNKYAIVGAQPAEQLVEAIHAIVSQRNANDNPAPPQA